METAYYAAVETAIEPELPICDCHHHLLFNLDRQYMPEDYLHDIGNGHNIVQTVFVESQSVVKNPLFNR